MESAWVARRDWADLIGGVLLVGFGTWFALHSAEAYNIGELRRMGPGFFPLVLGILVAVFGLVLIVPALLRPAPLPVPALRPLITIVGGGLAFAWLIEPTGLVPATVALVCVVVLAETEVRVVRTVILAAALSAMGVGVFTEGLGIPIPAFRWGF
jgi:hypothetical protein